MRRIAVLLLVIGAGCGNPTAPPADKGQVDNSRDKLPSVGKKPKHDYLGWKQYAPAEAAFEVQFPRQPIVKEPSPATGDFHVAVVQPQAVNDLMFVCLWNSQEKVRSSKEAVAAFLKGQQIGLMNSLKGKLVEEREAHLDGVQSREFIIELGNKTLLHCRTYLAGERVINLQVSGKDMESVRSAEAIKFFESLKISK